jgi:hypothetical protein
MDDFDFFSFEWYPFDDVCEDPAGPLARHPACSPTSCAARRRRGLPADVPKVITEYGYSSFVGQPEVEMPGAIVNAETAAELLALGGDTSYLYGLEPDDVFQEPESKPCNSWGNLMLFQIARGTAGPARWPRTRRADAQQTLGAAGDRPAHRVAAACAPEDRRRQPMVTAYALRRPDGRLAVLLLNKDPRRPITVRLARTSRRAHHAGGPGRWRVPVLPVAVELDRGPARRRLPGPSAAAVPVHIGRWTIHPVPPYSVDGGAHHRNRSGSRRSSRLRTVTASTTIEPPGVVVASGRRERAADGEVQQMK